MNVCPRGCHAPYSLLTVDDACLCALLQLLTEMDGFTPDTGVVFLGATNR